MEKTRMSKVYDENYKTKVLEEINGTKVMSYDDTVTAFMRDFNDGRVDITNRKINPDGSLARTNSPYSGVNVDMYYDNRYYVFNEDGIDKMGVVTDTRAIDEQKTGRVYSKLITVYVVKRDKSKKLVLEGMTTVSDIDFIKNYTNRLSNSAMSKIIPLIRVNHTVLEEKNMPI